LFSPPFRLSEWYWGYVACELPCPRARYAFTPPLSLLASALLLGASFPVRAAVRPTESAESPALPEVWQKVPAQQRLMTLRATEAGGTRLFLEWQK